jgi:tRNA (uracil-5-)-methyltransferase
VNTHGARLLYDLVGDWAVASTTTPTSPHASPGHDDGGSRKVIVADVCCGTGTIGMTLHDRVMDVLGFELVPSAVVDARLNADRNGLRNCRFFVGKAEVRTCGVRHGL